MTIKKVLIDLSGTLHIEDYAIPGAVEALKKLRNAKVEVKFVTNTTKESRRILYERLKKLGFELNIDEIWSSLWAARSLISDQKLAPLLLVDNHALEDFSEVCTSERKHDSVVIGLAPEHFHYEKLNEAFRLLKSGAKLIAIHQARYYKSPSGLSLGPGLFVKGLEYAADCKAFVVGKPSADFFKAALGDTDTSEAIMIGDDARDDIGGAQAIGIKGILVKTGKYKEGDEKLIDPHPAYTVDDFPKAVDVILNNL